MSDQQVHLYGSLLQHGKSNDRIYLMKYASRKREDLYRDMVSLAEKENYGKIFIKVPEPEEDFFRVRGFGREAVIPRFFGDYDGILMGTYLKENRLHIPQETQERIKKVLQVAVSGNSEPGKVLDQAYSIERLTPEHTKEMAQIYKQVFPSYPFPIDDPAYLLETMESHVAYFGCFRRGHLEGLSSAEMDKESSTVEMTDFAVLPENRGNQLALHLLREMEEFVRKEGYSVAYTIARAVSFGMNKTFANGGYTFGGTLWNNTQISGSIESMNIWHKQL